MSFQEKLRTAEQRLRDRGIAPAMYAPPVYRLLWRLGVPAVPPHFAGFRTNALFTGLSFGAGTGLLVWSGVLPRGSRGLPFVLLVLVLLGLLFGLAMACWYRFDARRHAVPAWKDLSPEHSGAGTTRGC